MFFVLLTTVYIFFVITYLFIYVLNIRDSLVMLFTLQFCIGTIKDDFLGVISDPAGS